jgi:hypothetical protein
MTSSTINQEALENLSAMFNSGKLKVTDLEVTGSTKLSDLQVSKDLKVSKNTSVGGDLDIGKNIKACGGNYRVTTAGDTLYMQTNMKNMRITDVGSTNTSKINRLQIGKSGLESGGSVFGTHLTGPKIWSGPHFRLDNSPSGAFNFINGKLLYGDREVVRYDDKIGIEHTSTYAKAKNNRVGFGGDRLYLHPPSHPDSHMKIKKI